MSGPGNGVSPPAVARAQHSPAAERNREPILLALQPLLPERGHALEIASGTGQHAAWLAAHLPGWTWQPSDAEADGFESITAWCQPAGVTNVRPAVLLDVLAARWPSGGSFHTDDAAGFDLIFCANMLHISPWATCAALMSGAARHLAPGGLLVTYGPYLEASCPTSPGNLDFDASLRARNPAWGIRAKEAVAAQAALAGLSLAERLAMPVGNLMLVFKRSAATV